MERTDLRQYNSGELSLQVFNTEYLYSMRSSLGLKAALEDMFLFTDDQWHELCIDIQDDIEDMESSNTTEVII